MGPKVKHGKTAKGKAADRATASPESPDHDDFDEYQQWIRRADKDDPEVSLRMIREQWDGLPDDRAAAFAAAVRDFQVDEGVKTFAETELRQVLQQVSNFELGDQRHDRRKLSGAAANLHKALVKTLGVWQLATRDLLSRLDALDTELTTMPREGLQSLLETYQRRLRDSIVSAQALIGPWIQVFGQFATDQLWTPENIQKLQDSARGLESDLITARSSLQSLPEIGSSPSKRKRNGDAERSRSKVPRRSRDPDVTHRSRDPNVMHSGSAKSGAARSQRRASRPAATEDHGQPNGEEFAELAVTVPDLLPPQGFQRSTPDRASIDATWTPLRSPSDPQNATQHVARNATTGRPYATPQLPPLPTVGEAGPWMQMIFGDLSQPSHSTFLSWCRRQLITANYHTLQECEPLAEAMYQLFRRTLHDHDWENESDMPPLPMTPEVLYKFNAGVGNGRMWGNLRRLFDIRRNAPLSFREYCNRNWAKDQFYVDNADSIARQILELVKEKGLSHDWDTENDVAENVPSTETTTANFPLVDLHQNGHWNFHQEVASGGNGRALLYCKRLNAADELGVALPPPSIPVVAVIYVFQAMAAGACLMAHGEVPDDRGRWPGDQPPAWTHNIIHRDIKPRNYFISSSQSSVIWPKLPVAALGDFGNAFDAVTLWGVGSSHRMGTENYMAPEQLPNYRTTYTVTAATNVYQIGVTIIQLMHLQRPRLQADYDTEDEASAFPGFPVNATFYPQALIDIAEDCIQPRPRDRPTPVRLYRRIRNLASGYPDESNKDIPWRKYQ
ncbi:hypothetical protein MBLNU13_g03081t2 [Cladosporium sp. NU13]